MTAFSLMTADFCFHCCNKNEHFNFNNLKSSLRTHYFRHFVSDNSTLTYRIQSNITIQTTYIHNIPTFTANAILFAKITNPVKLVMIYTHLPNIFGIFRWFLSTTVINCKGYFSAGWGSHTFAILKTKNLVWQELYPLPSDDGCDTQTTKQDELRCHNLEWIRLVVYWRITLVS